MMVAQLGKNLVIMILTFRKSFDILKINATHTWVGDLIGTIKAPNGKVLNLAYVLSGTGGTAVTTGLTNTIFASNATASFGNGTDPFSSTYAADAYLPSMAIANDPTNPSFPTTPNDPVQTGPDGYIPDVTNFSDLFSTPNGSPILATASTP